MMEIKFNTVQGTLKLISILLIIIGGLVMLIYGFIAGVISYSTAAENKAWIGSVVFATGIGLYVIISLIFGWKK